jgi:cell division protein FtsL
MLPELTWTLAVFHSLRRRVIHDRDAGATTMEWVIITAIAVTMAVVAGGIILAKVRSKANNVLTDTPQ